MPRASNRYIQLIETIFINHYREKLREFEFERVELEEAASVAGIPLPKNLGDILYTFRY